MRRVFTQNKGRYHVGEVKDWPRSTWDHFFPGWEEFTDDPEEHLKALASKKAPPAKKGKAA